MAKKKEPQEQVEIVGFLGVGLDNSDEHHRLTRSEHFVLVGGSQETHEKMQDTAIRFEESLRRLGKRLRETPPEEAARLLRELMES